MRKVPRSLKSRAGDNSLAFQWLGLLPSPAAIMGSMHGWGTRILQLAQLDPKKSINYQLTEWNFVFVWPKSLCSFSLTHPANQTPSPVNSTHHIAQTLPSSCAPGHWPQSGPLSPIWCHGPCLSHIQTLLGTTVRAVSPDCRSECSDLHVLPLLDQASERSSGQSLPPGAQISSMEMGSGSQESTYFEHSHRGSGQFVQREIRPSGENRTCGPVA